MPISDIERDTPDELPPLRTFTVKCDVNGGDYLVVRRTGSAFGVTLDAFSIGRHVASYMLTDSTLEQLSRHIDEIVEARRAEREEADE